VADDFATSGWHALLMEGRMTQGALHPAAKILHRGLAALPGSHLRCRICHGPFDGSGAKVARALGIRPSSFSMQLCGRCEVRARGEKTGAEVDIATVFADIRGSTQLSQRIGSEAYRDLIDRFYTTATDVLIGRGAIIEQLVGDQVAALFVPGLSGEDYVDRAILSAQDMQREFGVGDVDGPWVDVGIGIDAGRAFVGVVGTMGGMTELTVLGDVPNLTGRLASVAASGEVLLTKAAADRSTGTITKEPGTIEVKGVARPVTIYSLVPGDA